MNGKPFLSLHIINVDLAAANADTDISGATVLAMAKTGTGRRQPGEGGHDEELVLKQNTGYCLRFENQTNAAKYVDWILDFYQHTAK